MRGYTNFCAIYTPITLPRREEIYICARLCITNPVLPDFRNDNRVLRTHSGANRGFPSLPPTNITTQKNMAKRGEEFSTDDPQKVRKLSGDPGDKEESLIGGENPTEVQLLRREVGNLRDEIEAVTNKIGQMCLSHGSVITSIQFHTDYLESLSKKVANIELESKQRDIRIDRGEQKLKQQGNKLIMIDRTVQDLSKETKSKNIVINGLNERKGENACKIAVKFLKHITKGVSASDIENAYRLGTPGENKRPLLVKFKSTETKKNIIQKKASLKNVKGLKKVFCNEDLPESARQLRQNLREIGKYAVKIGYEGVKVSGNKIQINDKVYHERDLTLLPKELHLHNIKTRLIKGMICFEGSSSYLSSSFMAPLKMNDKHFSSADQAYYYQKAQFAGRTDYGNDIMECDNTKALKKMGLKIEQTPEWEDKQLRILTGIFILKFQQNPSLMEKLINTKDTPLLNCDLDTYWGTGRLLDSDEWEKSSDIPGRNMIGTILSNVRSRLMPAGGPGTSPNVSPVTDDPKKKVMVQGLTAKEIAMKIKPVILQRKEENGSDEKGIGTAQGAGAPSQEDSFGSIDHGGAMLKMLHTTMGATQTENDPKEEEVTHKNTSGISHKSVNKSGTEDKAEEESICSVKSSNSSSLLDLDEDSSALIDSFSVRDEHLHELVNTTLRGNIPNREKLANLPFPTANVSKSLERSMRAMNGEEDRNEMEKEDSQLIHSTPVNTVTSRRPARRSKRKADEKAKTDALLKELNL